jgi:UDP-glucuronate 4-epimerase
MKVLVTGAAGFIGSHLVERLLREGCQVVGLDSFDSYLYDAETKHRNLREIGEHKHWRFVEGDILDAELVPSLLAGVDLVAHIAALAGVRPSIAAPQKYIRTNIQGTLSLLDACRTAGVNRMLFASTSSVYGARSPEDVPFRESDPCVRPASPYAASKRSAELFCSNYRDLYGIGVLAVRYFTVYGPRQRPEMAIHQFTRLIANDRPVVLFGDGSSARDYTYIDDIVDGSWRACQRVTPGSFEIYNLGGSKTTALKDLVDQLAHRLGRRPRLQFEPDQPGDVPITYADVSKARRDLGYQPRVSIEDGLERFVAWYRQRAAG